MDAIIFLPLLVLAPFVILFILSKEMLENSRSAATPSHFTRATLISVFPLIGITFLSIPFLPHLRDPSLLPLSDLWWAPFSLGPSCLAGLAAAMFASRVNSRFASDGYYGAVATSDKAMSWCNVCFVLWVWMPLSWLAMWALEVLLAFPAAIALLIFFGVPLFSSRR